MATTAQQLIAFHKELQTAGLDDDLINEIVRDAAHTLIHRHGLNPPERPAYAVNPCCAQVFETMGRQHSDDCAQSE